MTLRQDISLLPYNTFHIDVKARYMASIETESQLLEILQSALTTKEPVYIIGSGSNILLTKDVQGLVLLNALRGIEIVFEDAMYTHVRFMGGEIWHHCVEWCIDHNLGGIENLALIPGTMGAAPVQNIGAYGVELKDVLLELEALNLKTLKKKIFSVTDCAFDYRNSIFKHEEKGNYFILSVTLRLSKHPVLQLDYGNIREELNKMGVQQPDIKAVAQAVINIRRHKLPDPQVVGNAGSFFKNPVIDETKFFELQTSYPTIPFYKTAVHYKIPAAWLIEHTHPEGASSWKGYREGNYGVHPRQALCLVNYLNASGNEIYALSERIITSVQQKFNIVLEREVNIW